jgi:hypothetical protein
MNLRKHLYLCLITAFVLLFQLLSPAVAAADGETPPPAETQVETVTPEPTEPPAEATATESPTVAEATATPTEASSTPEPAASPVETSATDALPTTVPAGAITLTPEAVESAPTEAPAQMETPTLPEVLQQLPEDTGVIVLNDQGQSLPLALQETADAIAQADPMWCPEGVPPGWPGCTTSYATMEDLLANAGTYINSQIVSGTIWITSGLVGDAAPVEIDGATYTNWANYGLSLQGGWSGVPGDTTIGANSIFSVPITIANWNNTVFLGNITAPAVNIEDTDGVLIIADVTADDVNIRRQRGRVDVYNSTANLNVTDSDINNNGLYSAGINIHSLYGDVTVDNSVFHGNGYDGIWMDSVNDVTVSNSFFYQNGNNGLGVYNANNVTLINSLFNGNGFNGATLVAVNSASIDGSSFDANGGNGSEIYYAGSVDIGGASTFNQNPGSGASIVNSGDITINNASFNNNLFHGIAITSATGNISLANITATASPASYGDGAYVDNTTGSGNVTLSGTNDFSNHSPGNSGMFIISNGDVTLSGLTSNNNGRGVNISQAANVSLTGSTFNNNVCECDGSGAYILASGNISVGQSAFFGNSLYLNSAGAVNVNQVVVNAAQGVGLGVETGGGDVVISNSRFLNSVPNVNLPIFPYGDGADIFPNGGNVTVTNSEFSGNEWGLWVANGNQVSIASSRFDTSTPPMNLIDLAVSCALTSIGLSFPENVLINTTVNADCTYLPPVTVINNAPQQVAVTDQSATVISETSTRRTFLVAPSEGGSSTAYQGKAEFWLVCQGKRKDPNFDNFKVYLPNGDRVDIYCPVSGKATITRLDNTTLPRELPIGYTYASAFEVQILQPVYPLQRDAATGDYLREPIPVIYGGGRIMASFVATPLQPGRRFTILYWDEASRRWIPLKDYILGRKFMLFPDDPSDERIIVIGVRLNTRNEPERIEITTNFPGIFVLAQE